VEVDIKTVKTEGELLPFLPSGWFTSWKYVWW